MKKESCRIKGLLIDVPLSAVGIQDALQAVCQWDQDPIGMLKDIMDKAGCFGDLKADITFRFLRHHPVYCGLLIHRMRTAFHDSGSGTMIKKDE